MRDLSCPVCGRSPLEPFFELRAVPVHCNVLFDTAEAARSATRGALELGICPTCTAIHNVAFDEALVQYAPGYENSLHYSGVFQEYARGLAEHLVERHELRDRHVVEVGCGGGDFLRMLCAAGSNRGTGYDPGQTRADDDVEGDVRIVRRSFDDVAEPARGDLVVSRHVLEHLDAPLELLGRMREELGRDAAVLYLEVPEARYSLEHEGYWDLIYEHCTYFGAPSLETALRRSGFEPLELRSAYGGQFLAAEARFGEAEPEHVPSADAGPPLLALAGRFADGYRRTVDAWEATLDTLRREGRSCVAWGAGSKGVTFLNTLDPHARAISSIVDRNPHKHGRFVPGSAQEVIAPDALRGAACDAVIALNPLYRREIERDLERLGVRADVLCAPLASDARDR